MWISGTAPARPGPRRCSSRRRSRGGCRPAGTPRWRRRPGFARPWDVLEREQVGRAAQVERQGALGEAAEPALEGAHVGVVDVAVADVGDVSPTTARRSSSATSATAATSGPRAVIRLPVCRGIEKAGRALERVRSPLRNDVDGHPGRLLFKGGPAADDRNVLQRAVVEVGARSAVLAVQGEPVEVVGDRGPVDRVCDVSRNRGSRSSARPGWRSRCPRR